MPKRTKPKPQRWRVYLMRGRRAEYLGDVQADNEAEARTRACEEYGITASWQKRRVLVERA